MRYPFALALFFASAVHGQISSLAANAGGTELQFVSDYGLKDDPDSLPARRIYRYSPARPEVITNAGLGSPILPMSPYVSDDGQTRGWFTTRTCLGPCMFARPSGGVTLVRNGKALEFFGQTFRLSRNGRWLFDSGFPNLSPGATLTDIDTGAVTRLPNLHPLHSTHAVADDGTIVSTPPSQIPGIRPEPSKSIFLSAPPVTISLPDIVLSAAITPNGRKLFVLTKTTLYELDHGTLSPRVLHQSADPLIAFSPSALGDRVLLHTATQALLIDANGALPLPTGEASVSELLLSADGSTVFAVTAPNCLLRIRNGQAEELYPPFPSFARQTSSGAFPGSLIRLSGGPFSPGQSLSVQGREFPVVAIDKDTYEAQIPWDFDPAAGNRYTLSGPDSPFTLHSLLSFNSETVPAIYTTYPSGEVKAAQADFASLVTRENPAPAGSLIHIWLTGLGPLDRPLRTGEPGPADEPARPLIPIACYISNDAGIPAPRGLEIPFLAYAPALLGVYQADLVLPADWPSGPATLACRLADGYRGTIGTTYIRANSN